MKVYLCSVWAFYFQICALVKANSKAEAQEILCRHYQPRYPRIELESVAVYEVDNLDYDKDDLYEISRSD